jgi:hypothetical protein
LYNYILYAKFELKPKLEVTEQYRASYFSFELCALCVVSTFIGLTGLLSVCFVVFFLDSGKKSLPVILPNTKAKKESMEKITHPSPHTHQRRFEGAVFKPIVIFL